MRVILCLFYALPPLAICQIQTPVVEVYCPRVDPPMAVAFYHAQNIAAEVFSQIGVRVQWRLARRLHREIANVPMNCAILLDFSWETPSNSHPGALAVSYPYAAGCGCVTVFMDRFKPVVERSPTEPAFLLGHVLAHEFGHVLQGVKRHSAAGVLKEQWSVTEIRRMPVERLRFTDEDSELILRGIRSRTAVDRFALVTMQESCANASRDKGIQ